MPVQTSASITVGMDGSAGALTALRWASGEAQQRGLGIHLLACVFLPGVGYSPHVALSPPALAVITEAMEAGLDRAGELVVEVCPGVAVSSELVCAHPVDALRDATSRSALTVIGRRGAGGFRRLLAGSVALGLPAHARGPVVVVPGTPPPPSGTAVVVGVSGEATDKAVLAAAYQAASFAGARLYAVHSWDDSPLFDPRLAKNPLIQQEINRVQDEERRCLLEQLNGWAEQYPDVAVHPLSRRNSAAASVLDVADQENAALIVVGSRGRGPIASALLGSVSRAIIQHSTHPVMIVPV